MDTLIKEFIEKNIGLIESNDWEEVYKRYHNTHLYILGEFTPTLLKVGIDPLKYLDYIPNEYLMRSNITSFKVPNNIVSINGRAFSNCNLLEDIILPNTLTTIGDSAFENCSKLNSIVIPDSVMDIGGWAFSYCSKLPRITIPNNISHIGEWAFCECHRLRDVSFRGTKEQWGSIIKGRYLFHKSPVNTIHCKDGDIEI
jgi:hypothetical protein